MSYDDTLPEDRDKARFLLGDTASTELLADDLYDVVLALYPFNSAVAFMAEGLAARFAQNPSSVSLPSGLAVSWSERVKYWKGLAAQMRSGGVTASGAFSRTPTRSDGYADYAAEQAL